MFTRTLSALAAAALTVGTLAVSTPLRAAPAEEEQVSIRISDLDLSTARGAATLERRVRSDAQLICDWAPALDLDLRGKISECEESVVANARPDVEIAIHASRRGQQIGRYSR